MKVKIFRPLRLTAVWLAIWLTALLCFPVSAASPRLAGDLNGDGRMAAEDLAVLRRALLGISDGYEEETLDINLDGTVDIRDLVALATIIAGREGRRCADGAVGHAVRHNGHAVRAEHLDRMGIRRRFICGADLS